MKKGVVVEKLKRRAFTAEFKIEVVKLVTENGLSYAEVGRRLDVLPKLIKTWENTYRGECAKPRDYAAIAIAESLAASVAGGRCSNGSR